MSKSIAEINSIQLVGGHPGRHLDKKFTSHFDQKGYLKFMNEIIL